MEIVKRKNRKHNKQQTDIEFEIPMTISLFGEKDFEGCAEIAQAQLNSYAGTIFEHLTYLTAQAENDEIILPHYFEMINMLSTIGSGISETSARIETEKSRNKSKIKPSNKPLDLSYNRIGGVQ